jgi:uncharacterized protein
MTPVRDSAFPLRPERMSAWVLSDGVAGHEAQTLGIAEALGLSPRVIRLAPRKFYAFLAPYGPIDPRDAPSAPESPIAPPYPNILIAAGRRTVPYLRRVRSASNGTFTVFVNDPRTGVSTADVIVAPRHDRLSGPNVLSPATPANRITDARLAAARAHPDPRIAALPQPRAAMLIGGDSGRYRFSPEDADKVAEIARVLMATGASIMATASRRTPAHVVEALRSAILEGRGFLWDGSGENPYVSMLANAATIFVTADSVNMLGEAAATGAPVYYYEPSGGHRKMTDYHSALEAIGVARRWNGSVERWTYPPLNSTAEIAAAIARAYEAFRRSETGRSAAGAPCSAAHNG